MKVSVIVPIYNMEKYLKVCLNSIINQTYKNLEILLILDGCTDKSLEICQSFESKDKRIRIYNKINGGVSSARNYGLNKSSGEYIMFVDPDDWIEKDAIESAVKTLEYNKVDIVQFNFNKYYEKDKKIKKNEKIIEGRIDREIAILANLSNLYVKKVYNKFLGEIRCVWGKLYKAGILENIYFFEDIYIFEDGIFNLYAFDKSDNIYFMKETLYNYRIMEKSANNKFKKDCKEQSDNILIHIRNFIINKRTKYEELYNMVVYENFMRIINQYICRNENKLSDDLKIKEIKRIAESELYKVGLKKVKFKYFNIKNKILIFLIKFKLYRQLYIIYIKKMSNYKTKE